VPRPSVGYRLDELRLTIARNSDWPEGVSDGIGKHR